MALFTVLHAALPYCLKKQPNGKWVLVNREYKPIGFFTKQHVEYADYPVEMEIEGLTARVAKQVSYSGEYDGDEIFLYNDGCVPTHSEENMAAYMARLKVLARLKLDPNKLPH